MIAQVNPNYHYVQGHYRVDGVYVKGHYKTNSNETNRDNYTTKPNINPWTGQLGYVEPDIYYIAENPSNYESEYLSPEYNSAKELFDKKQYLKSIEFCKDAIKRFPKPYLSLELLGWNYLLIEENDFALKSFSDNYEKIIQSPSSASPLYLCYLINNDIEKANQLKKKFALNEKEFNRCLREDIKRLNLTVGIPSIEILKLVLDDENLYLNQSLIMSTYHCFNCKVEFLTKTIINIGEGQLKKRFFLKNTIEGNCIAIEIQCPRKYRDNIENILNSLNFDGKKYIEIPVARKIGDTRPKITQAEIYIRNKNSVISGIIISDLDLEGDINTDYFTIAIRQ